MPKKIQRPPADSRRAIRLAAALVVLAILIAYHNTFAVPFLFDDQKSISLNPTIRHLWPIWDALAPPIGLATVNARPLLNLSFALNYALGGDRVFGYHVFNLGVHILASLVLLGIVRRTLLIKKELRTRFDKAALPLATAIALLLAVHPLQTEAVTYIGQRAESLMGLCYLLTLYCFIRGIESPSRYWFGCAVVACWFGMAIKEVMVSAPIIVLLYDRAFVTGTFREALRRRWQVYAGLCASWLLLASLVIHGHDLSSGRAGAGNIWRPYVLTQFWAIAHYLRLAVWPHPLVFDYGTPLVTEMAKVVPAALLVILLVCGTAICLWRWPMAGFPGCWFFAVLAPTSSILPLMGQTVAEHRMYLALAPVVVIFVLSVHTFARRGSMVLFTIVAAIWIVLTVCRNGDYRDAETIWKDTIQKRPDNPRAQFNLSNVFLDEGRLDEAIEGYSRVIAMSPNDADSHYYRGLALGKQQRLDEAIAQFQTVLKLEPNRPDAHSNLGYALFLQEKNEDAIREFRQAEALDPNSATIHYRLGYALGRQGNLDEAIQEFQKTLELSPTNDSARRNLESLINLKKQSPEDTMNQPASQK